MFKNLVFGMSVLYCVNAIAQQPVPSFPTLGLALHEKLRETPSVSVARVGEGTPASAAGLLPGDLVVRVGERPITKIVDVMAALDQVVPGASVEIVVRRGAREQALRVTPGPAQYFL
jgi:S1-C subfamily serine protease